MSKAKFIKGNWIIVKNKYDFSIESNHQHNGFFDLICTSVYWESNANLIASAPHMYAEIERDIECLTRWIDSHGDAFPMADAWKEMRANKIKLLAKARGEHEG